MQNQVQELNNSFNTCRCHRQIADVCNPGRAAWKPTAPDKKGKEGSHSEHVVRRSLCESARTCALARLRSAELSLPLLIEPSVTFPERDRVCGKNAQVGD
eukprot:126620-Pelagomonas_calceolata.AAC.1